MKFTQHTCGLGVALALACSLPAPAHAALVLLGSDYLETVRPSFFTVPGPTVIQVKGLPIGPGSTDTIVQRKANCSLSLSSSGSNCTIPIEMVALSLVSIANPMLRVRESPTLASTGMMTIFSDGTGSGGTFNSFFDVFIELSMDGGMNWQPFDADPLTLPIDPKHFTSGGTGWTTIPDGVLVDGLVGNQNANRHTNKGTDVDFYIKGVVFEDAGNAEHRARAAIPEPGSLALIGLALVSMISLGRRSKHRGRVSRYGNGVMTHENENGVKNENGVRHD